MVEKILALQETIERRKLPGKKSGSLVGSTQCDIHIAGHTRKQWALFPSVLRKLVSRTICWSFNAKVCGEEGTYGPAPTNVNPSL